MLDASAIFVSTRRRMPASVCWPVTWPLVYVVVVLPHPICILINGADSLLHRYSLHSPSSANTIRSWILDTYRKSQKHDQLDGLHGETMCTNSSEVGVTEEMLRKLTKQVEEMEVVGENVRDILNPDIAEN
jgi:hypothetical protein